MLSITRFIKSLITAFGGLVYVVRTEPNARIHLLIAIGALLLGLVLQISNAELAAIFFAILIVFVSEVVNTAIERTLDLVSPADNDQVRIIKDIAAGAVLVAAIGAGAIGIAIFIPHIITFQWR